MSQLQPLVEEECERPEVEVVDCLLGRHLKMSTKENRNFTGTLMCVDHFGNLLLYDAVEEINTGTKTHKRVLNQVIISMDKLRAVSVLAPRCQLLWTSTADTFFMQVTRDDKVLRIMLEDQIKAVAV